MTILIVVATNLEIELLHETLHAGQRISPKIRKYTFDKLQIDILITGIGGVATSYHLTKTIANNKYDLLINAGIAGSFSRELQIGEVVNVIEDQFTDLGIEDGDKFYTLFEKNFVDEDEYPYRNSILRNTTPIKYQAIKNLIKVLGTTSNTVHGNSESIEKLKDKFCLDTESMEGAVFFYVALMEGIPFYQIRSVSNFVDIRENNCWDASLAIKNLTTTMVEILSEINETL